MFQIEWKNKEEETENGDTNGTEAITNGMKVLDMDENTKGIPKVRLLDKLMDRQANSQTDIQIERLTVAGQKVRSNLEIAKQVDRF